ncbi:RNA-binding protein 48 [Apophysomyces sp. BC1034]|nr:RNA-binding protein 48 [Apophysomyces sp. BC1015]KAG0170095.1 RNA-binding protein 48 [Apophysomyces sp. BC1021]KAG0184555.1 RNA-binding protein 48 [Apophysomyces sp. BC1034]
MATNRPAYRDPKTPRAVCVYTVAQESRYLIFENVPALGLREELLKQCQAYGQVDECHLLDDHPSSTEYMDVVWIRFSTMASARMAKRRMDDRNFYASILRVSYAPEYETVDDVRHKLQERKAAMVRRLTKNPRKEMSAQGSSQARIVYGPTLPTTPRKVGIEQPKVKKRRRI